MHPQSFSNFAFRNCFSTFFVILLFFYHFINNYYLLLLVNIKLTIISSNQIFSYLFIHVLFIYFS